MQAWSMDKAAAVIIASAAICWALFTILQPNKDEP